MLKLLLVHCLLLPLEFGFELTILHTNDFHDRIEETDEYSGACSAEDSKAGKCYGGVSRLATKVKELRAQYPDSLLLDAGDWFQGTLWYYHFGGSITSIFMNLIRYDAMGLGNHEFDNGVAGLVPFVDNVSFPLLSSNIDLSDTPELQDKIAKSVVVPVGGQSIGIIGYTTSETPYISNPGTVKFTEELEAIQAEAYRLKALGINKIIALGHAGFDVDQDLARQLDGVDVIVGGHTNTFLYNGEVPSNDEAAGGYPAVERSDATGDTVLIVQSYAYGKYLGLLHVMFDDAGKVKDFNGNPILMDTFIEKDAEVESVVQLYLPQVEALDSEVIGSTHVFLEGSSSVCRVTECNMGNLITDGMLKQNIRHADSTYWSDVTIAIHNGGGIRSSIDVGDIDIGDAILVQPFRNTIDIVELYGSSLLRVLEQSASLWSDGADAYGGFLQVSGLLVVYDMSQPVGQRVADVKVRCSNCTVPQFEPLEKDTLYQILMNAFLADGGDQYDVILAETVDRHIIGDLDVDIMIEYIKSTSPLISGLEGRIRFMQDVWDDPLTLKLLDFDPSQDSTSDSMSSLIGGQLLIILVTSLVSLLAAL